MTNPDKTLKIGLSSVITTPLEPIWLYGYASPKREKPFEGKEHDVYANSIAFEDPSGSKSLLITLDLCVLRKNEALKVMKLLTERTGIREERIIINLSHTHSGPMIGSEDSGRYPLSPEMAEKTTKYTDWLMERICESAEKALNDLRPALLSWGRGKISFVRNRRLFDEDGKYKKMGPNPDGFCDPSVTVLKVTEPDGTLRGLLCSLSCHAVTLGPDNIKLCGDYPGFAKQYLAERHRGVVPFFVQGFGADANSEPRATEDQMEWVKRHGKELADEVDRVIKEKMKPLEGDISAVKKEIELPPRQRSREQLEIDAKGPDSTSHNPKRILQMLDRRETPPVKYKTPVAIWKFSNDLTLLALPGETTGEYIPLISEIIPPENLWFAGYSNEVFGYFPTARIIHEGGYEDRGLVCEVGQFAEEVEEVVLESVKRLYNSLQ